ncbi:MAG: serine/threonine protein kinase [Granulosicoccus sp.]|nr:serine/threonine protein kinase [Granulosicoccus sp.]
MNRVLLKFDPNGMMPRLMETIAPYRSLRPGEMLNWYRIERILGHGGFGVIYLATDTNLQHQVAIKEYRLLVPAGRVDTASVTEERRQRASEGMQRFIVEARNLVRFNHPNIVRVMSVFELNDSAYMVMEFEAGQDLREYLRIPKHTSELALKNLFVPISEGLAEVHKHGYVHRDIKPANILVRTDETPVLLDFGSARPAMPVDSNTLTALVSAGYSALEQYTGGSEREQGPWTDIYSLGAVLYFAISGADPVDSAKRGTALLNGGKDPLVPARIIGQERYSSGFLQAIDWALAVRIADRPRQLSEWMEVLLGSTLRRKPTQRIDSTDQAVPMDTGEPLDPLHGPSMRDRPVPRNVNTARARRFRGRRAMRVAWVVLALTVVIAGTMLWILSDATNGGDVTTADRQQAVVIDARVAQTRPDEDAAMRSAAEKADTEKITQLARENAEAAAAEKTAAEAQAEAAAQAKAAAQAAARVQAAAAEQARRDSQEAERRARLRARRIQLVTALEQASILLDQGQLVEAQAALDEAASIDRNDATLKTLRSRWRTALIDSQIPVSDEEFDRMIEQFDKLRRALESNDVATMEALTDSSDQNALFRQLMSRFASLDIRIDRIRVRNVDKTISARLRIETMIRSSGERAIPSPAYQDRTISSRRIEGQWSLIQW